jgi:hypothetical protein
VTSKLPPDQGRAPCLYDEQLQRQQQEKILMGAREGRPDLLDLPPHRRMGRGTTHSVVEG